MFFEKELETAGVNCERLSKKESFCLQKEWLELFANRVKEKTGKWVIDGFMWSGFYQGIQPCLMEEKAFQKYIGQKVEEYYIFDESGKHAYRCSSVEYPDFRSFGRDIYLMPKSELWTMVFSHEMAVYFAEV